MVCIKWLIALALLGLALPAGAAQVKILNSTTATASGSGAAGTPSISAFNIPAGKNRILFIFSAFERDHCDLATDNCTLNNYSGAGLYDNFPRVAPTNTQITARVIGPASTINKQNALTVGGTPSGDLCFSAMETGIQGYANTTFFSEDSYHIALNESEIQTLLGGGLHPVMLPSVCRMCQTRKVQVTKLF